MNRFNIFNILKEHYKTFYDAGVGTIGNRVIDIRDIVMYHIYPAILLIIPAVYWGYNHYFLKYNLICIINSTNSFISSSITAISIFAPLLFSTLILIFDMQNKFKDKLANISKSENNEQESYIILKKIVLANEMFAHICFAEVVCIIILLLSFLYMLIPYYIVSLIIIFTNIYLILLFFETLFIVMKRLFNLIYQ